MTHPTATHAAIVPEQDFVLRQAGSGWHAESWVAGLTSAESESDFSSRMANFLEMPSAGFHYSVIGGARIAMVPRLADCHLLTDEVAACAAGLTVLVPGHEQMTSDDASDQIEPVAASGGGRKIYAKDHAFVGSMQVEITVARIRMTRNAGNIRATYPPFATVAPIFHRSVDANPTGRGITPNTIGAAA